MTKKKKTKKQMKKRKPATKRKIKKMRAKKKKSISRKRPRTLRKRKEPEMFISEATIDELIKRGRARGFITETEILHFVPQIEKNIEELEELYDKLAEANIKIVEARDLIEEEPVVEEELKRKPLEAGLDQATLD